MNDGGERRRNGRHARPNERSDRRGRSTAIQHGENENVPGVHQGVNGNGNENVRVYEIHYARSGSDVHGRHRLNARAHEVLEASADAWENGNANDRGYGCESPRRGRSHHLRIS